MGEGVDTCRFSGETKREVEEPRPYDVRTGVGPFGGVGADGEADHLECWGVVKGEMPPSLYLSRQGAASSSWQFRQLFTTY